MNRFVCAIALMLSGAAGLVCADASALDPEGRSAIHRIAQEIEIARALDALSGAAVRGDIVFKDVSVVDAVRARSTPHQSVVVRKDKIVWVGDAARAPIVKDAFVVDGEGLFLSPGLVDMHVHTQSLGEQLLRLATGITSVRDMDGFPWMLRLRRAANSGEVLAPAAYIAGTIIADQPLSGYAVVVANEGEARRLVRDQAACGYDFIKVHNSLALKLFDAVADEARRAGKDLVGHVPHDISIGHAVHAGGMRTLEHLKGFIDDRTLAVSAEDYGAALKGAQVWLTPTFYVLRGEPRGTAALAELTRPEMRYVPAAKRSAWRETAMLEPDWRARLAAALPVTVRRFLRLSSRDALDTAVPRAMARLLPLHPHWLAGTDSAQYDFQIPGYALLDELGLMEKHGIGRADVLRAATSEPATAMRRDGEFGRIVPGLRADMILLAGDPLKDLGAFRASRGVMARGAWLDPEILQTARSELARIYAEPDASFALSPAIADALAARTLELSQRNVALDPRLLNPAIAALQEIGYANAAKTMMAADLEAAPGPCNHPPAEN